MPLRRRTVYLFDYEFRLIWLFAVFSRRFFTRLDVSCTRVKRELIPWCTGIVVQLQSCGAMTLQYSSSAELFWLGFLNNEVNICVEVIPTQNNTASLFAYSIPSLDL